MTVLKRHPLFQATQIPSTPLTLYFVMILFNQIRLDLKNSLLPLPKLRLHRKQFKVVETESFSAQTVTVNLWGLFISSNKWHTRHSVPTHISQTLAWICYIMCKYTVFTEKLEVILMHFSAESIISQRATTTSNRVKDI